MLSIAIGFPITHDAEFAFAKVNICPFPLPSQKRNNETMNQIISFKLAILVS